MRTVLVGGLGLALLAVAGWWLLRPSAPPVESTLPMAGEAAARSAEAGGVAAAPEGEPALADVGPTTAPELIVQAAGAVAEPGVYRLAPGARVDDLVRAAGGLTDRADADRVNLAAPLADGERVWVPADGEEEPPPVVAGSGGGGGGGPGTVAPGGGTGGATTPEPASPVDLNTATAEELDALPGIGPATAAAILAHREQIGRFGSVDELLDVRGIGEAKLEQLRPLVRV